MISEADTKYCDCHYKHTAQMENLKDADSLSRSDRHDLWEELNTKVNMKMFFLLIAIFIGTFSFQLLVYNSVRTIEADVAVLKYESKFHTRDNLGAR